MASKVAGSTKWYSRPSCSPGRGERVVYEIESASPGSSASTAFTSEVLPAPEGAATTMRLPVIGLDLNLE